MKVIIVHYHLRPGGIRRIIELGTPWLIGGRREVEVVLATGEARDRNWNQTFQDQLGSIPLTFFVEPSFGYLSEQKESPARIGRRVRDGLEKLLHELDARSALVWAHNLGIGRNIILTRELTAACARRGLTLISHHHDWWFDNRWPRWREMRRHGTRTLLAAARAVFPADPSVRHAAINQADAAVLQRHLPERSAWVPNLAQPATSPSPDRLDAARTWLRRHLHGHHGPVWILPCRLLRRKNVAEALLLTRWLRPDARLVITGGVSSAEEQPYANALADAARSHRWPLHLGLLEGHPAHAPSVHELLSACEAVLLTSIQEGFGLPYLEAAAAGRPLVARALDNISPDLKQLGFRFPQLYDEISVDPALFDWDWERRRQADLFRAWIAQVPAACRALVPRPPMLRASAEPGPAAFSRLTLDAQLQVLAHPVEDSWNRCATLNAFLAPWRNAAGQGALEVSSWPRRAALELSGRVYGERLRALAEMRPALATAQEALAAQNDFIRGKLNDLYPLLWATRT